MTRITEENRGTKEIARKSTQHTAPRRDRPTVVRLKRKLSRNISTERVSFRATRTLRTGGPGAPVESKHMVSAAEIVPEHAPDRGDATTTTTTTASPPQVYNSCPSAVRVMMSRRRDIRHLRRSLGRAGEGGVERISSAVGRRT